MKFRDFGGLPQNRRKGVSWYFNLFMRSVTNIVYRKKASDLILGSVNVSSDNTYFNFVVRPSFKERSEYNVQI